MYSHSVQRLFNHFYSDRKHYENIEFNGDLNNKVQNLNHRILADCKIVLVKNMGE